MGSCTSSGRLICGGAHSGGCAQAGGLGGEHSGGRGGSFMQLLPQAQRSRRLAHDARLRRLRRVRRVRAHQRRRRGNFMQPSNPIILGHSGAGAGAAARRIVFAAAAGFPRGLRSEGPNGAGVRCGRHLQRCLVRCSGRRQHGGVD